MNFRLWVIYYFLNLIYLELPIKHTYFQCGGFLRPISSSIMRVSFIDFSFHVIHMVHPLSSWIVHFMIQAWNLVQVHSLMRWLRWKVDPNRKMPLKAIFRLGYWTPVLCVVALYNMKTVYDTDTKLVFIHKLIRWTRWKMDPDRKMPPKAIFRPCTWSQSSVGFPSIT